MTIFSFNPLEQQAQYDHARQHPYIPPTDVAFGQLLPADNMLVACLVIGLASALLAFALNRTRLLKIPQDYRWGFFQCITTFLWVPYLLYWYIYFSNDARYWITNGGLWLGWLGALTLASISAFQQTRLGWVTLTVISANPLFWIINIVYGRNRWASFSQRTGFEFIPTMSIAFRESLRNLRRRAKRRFGRLPPY